VPTVNVTATALRFLFRVTLKRSDLADAVVSAREPRRLPIVLSREEVGRLLTSATNIKHRAALSLAYATGLRASEVVSLKLTDITPLSPPPNTAPTRRRYLTGSADASPTATLGATFGRQNLKTIEYQITAPIPSRAAKPAPAGRSTVVLSGTDKSDQAAATNSP
jgi:hypothetical protein